MRKRFKGFALKSLKQCVQSLLVLLLLLQSTIVAFLLNYRYVPLPTKWANKQLLTKTFNGFHIQAKSFRLKFSGEIELIGVRVYSIEAQKPILEATCTTIQYGFNEKGWFQFNLKELTVTNGTLLMPGIYAPNGKRTAILERVTFHLKPTKHFIRIDSFAAMHEDIYLRGSIEWPIRSGGVESEIPPIRQFYELSASALKEKDKFSPFIKPTLEFSLSSHWDKSVDVSLRLSSEELEYDQAVGAYFTFDTSFKLSNGSLIAQTPLLLCAQKITFPELDLCAEELTAQITSDRWPDLFEGTLSEFEVSAYRLTTNEITLDSPRIRIYPRDFPELQFSGSTSGLKGGVAFFGKFDTVRKSGQIFANGSIDLFGMIPETVLCKLPQLEFDSKPFYDFSMTLKEGLVLDRAVFRMDVCEVTANGVFFDHILAKGSYEKNSLNLNRVLINRKNQWVDGTFGFDGLTNAFKLTLNGFAHPREYSLLLPKWWDGIFADLDFLQESPAFGDFAIYGSTSKGSKNLFFGQAKASNFAYKNANIDSCQLIVRGRKNYVELHQIEAEADSGWATGTIRFTQAPKPQKGLLSIRYKFDGSISPEIPATIFGGEIAEVVNDFELTALPSVKVNGVSFLNENSQYQGNSNIYIEANVQAPLTFKKIPLQYLNFKLYGRENNIFLRDLNFGYANGAANAAIDIEKEDKQMCFQLNLRGANQSKTIEDLPDFDDPESQSKTSRTNAQKQASCTGLLNINLHAKGPLDELYGFTGYGNLEIQNEALGAIQVLGPLSEWLKNTRLNFTSFNLNRVDAIFEIDREQIVINDLEINGPRTRIWANGTYQLPNQGLKIGVRVSLFANSGTPDSTFNKFGNFIATPFPNLLVFNLTGTVYDQKIRSQFDPRNLIPGF